MTPQKYMGLVAGLVILCALSVMPASAQTDKMTGDVVGNVTLNITNQGITGIPTTAEGGLYVVTVKNTSNEARGLVIRGVDLCCSPYTRFTKVLQPGQQTTFRWFFPDDRMVQIRDLIQCKPAERTCIAPVVGGFSTTVMFG